MAFMTKASVSFSFTLCDMRGLELSYWLKSTTGGIAFELRMRAQVEKGAAALTRGR